MGVIGRTARETVSNYNFEEYTFRGRTITELSREELMEAVVVLGRIQAVNEGRTPPPVDGEESKVLTDTDPMPFGKHRGTPMMNVEASYLDYIYDKDWIDQWPRVKKYIEDNRTRINKELEEEAEAKGGMFPEEESDWPPPDTPF